MPSDTLNLAGTTGGFVEAKLVWEPERVRILCTRPYPRHPKGCPNYGKKYGCPPQAPLLINLLDLARPTWVIYNRFDLGKHVAAKNEKHPKWSSAQLYSCLYWQGTARKELRALVKAFLHTRFTSPPPALRKNLVVLMCPEATGVNVTATMAAVGIHLEWPPIVYAYQVAVAGYRR